MEAFYGHGVSSRKSQKIQGGHKIGAAISGPRIAGGNSSAKLPLQDLVSCDMKSVAAAGLLRLPLGRRRQLQRRLARRYQPKQQPKQPAKPRGKPRQKQRLQQSRRPSPKQRPLPSHLAAQLSRGCVELCSCSGKEKEHKLKAKFLHMAFCAAFNPNLGANFWELCGVIRANRFARFGWFARIGNSSD